jgi:hypothetical protein
VSISEVIRECVSWGGVGWGGVEEIKLALPRVSETLDEVSEQSRYVYRNKRE